MIIFISNSPENHFLPEYFQCVIHQNILIEKMVLTHPTVQTLKYFTIN